MKCLLSVCLAAFSVVAVSVHSAVVQSSTRALSTAQNAASQAMQKGVSVELASANSAQPMPEADNADAWIVTIARGGRLFFGIKPVTASELKEQLIRHPRQRGQRLYIKTDARALFADLEKVLDAASAAEVESPILLTGQHREVTPGTVVPPEGFEVLVDGMEKPGAKAAVELTTSAQGSPRLMINNTRIPWASLQDGIKAVVQNRKEMIVELTADARSPFAEVAQVIDACQSAGAKVVLGGAGL